MLTSHSLEDVRRHPGAVTTRREDRAVTAHYGSAAGELAACVRSVGLADRSDLSTLIVRGDRRHVDKLANDHLDCCVAPGGAVRVGESWWLRSPISNELVIVCTARLVDRLRARLHDETRRRLAVEVIDGAHSYAVVNVLGARTGELLATLGVYGPDGDAGDVSTVTRHAIGDVAATWLLAGPRDALAIVERPSAARLWHHIAAAGRSFGIAYVGLDAVERLALTERTLVRSALVGV